MRALWALLLLALLSSCATVQKSATRNYSEEDSVCVAHVTKDSVREVSNRRDSIYVRDSTYIWQSGDTLMIYKERTMWRDRWRTDTILKARHDTLYRYRTIVKTETITKPMAKKESWVRAVGLCVLLLAAIVICSMLAIREIIQKSDKE